MKQGILISLFFLIYVFNAYSQTNENFLKGLKFFSEKKFLMAISSFKKALEAGYQDPKLNFYLANAYVNNEEFDKAIEQYRVAYELADNQSFQGIIAHNMGYTYFLKKDFRRAIEFLNKAYQLDNKLVQAFWFKGMAYYRLKDKPNTIKEWEEYLVQAPNGRESDNIRKALMILKSENFDFGKDKLFPDEGGTNESGSKINVEPLIDIQGVLDEIKPVDKGKVSDEEMEEIEK